MNLQIDDIEDQDLNNNEEEDSVSTLMWNPLHHAVYYQNIELLKHMVKEMKVSWSICGPKAPAENERENVNNDKYAEDKIMVLLLAYDRRNP